MVIMIIVALMPIVGLLTCLLIFKMTAVKSSAYSMLITMAAAYFAYKVDILGLSISTAKGLSLSLSIILIIWGAVFLYNLVSEVGALNVINRNIELIIEDRFIQFLFLSWIFSAFLQGVAGFGVPVVVVVPILVSMGFEPVASAAAVLVGHSWAISFGSMGSSVYAMDMVTNTDIGSIVMWMVFFDIIAMFLTGITVCYIYGGIPCIKNGITYIALLTIIMGSTLSIVTKLGMLSMLALLTAFVGLFALYIIYRLRFKRQSTQRLYSDRLNLMDSLLPYVLIIAFSFMVYFINPQVSISLNFPGYITAIGNMVKAETNYAMINIFKHPTMIIMVSSLISIVLYRRKKGFDLKSLKAVASATVKKCASITITLAFLISIAVLMMDSGMINCLAQQAVQTTGKFYPLFAPFVGLLGSFITGSNTNSNVIFGSLQETVANSLGINPAIMCGVQSIGASIGGGIGPTTVTLGAAAAQIQGRESRIYNKTLLATLMMALVLGLSNYYIISF